MTSNSDDLQASIRRLQFWNNALIAAVAALGIMVAINAASKDGVIQAQRVELLSDSGDVLAELAVRNGNPGLYLRDSDGVERAALLHSADGTGLYIMDADSVTRIGIAQFSHGGGGVALHGKDSKGAAVLYLKDEGSLRFFDAEGVVTNQVTSTEQAGE